MPGLDSASIWCHCVSQHQPPKLKQIAKSCAAGHAHTFWNGDSTQDLEVEFTVSPHGNMLPFFQTYCGLAQDSKDGTLDSVNPLQLMVTIKAAGMSMDVMPKPVWWLLSHVVLPLSESVYQPFYPEYTGGLS